MTAALRVRALYALLACLLVPTAAAAQKLATGSGPGASPAVRVFDASGTDTIFFAYDPLFPGGVRVALGDVTGDGVLDIITGAGPRGGPHVRVWNGTDLTEVGGFFAYDPTFPGGVFVAAGDVNGDGRADIITGAGAGGGPHVRVWSGADFTEIFGFFAYDPAFPGGVTVAAADVNGDGLADIITGAGPGGGPHVRVWNAADFTEIGGFFAYDPAFPGGVNVAAADVDGDGLADIVTGAGPGGGPHVRVWSGATFGELGGFFAYDPAFPGGVVVGTVDLDRDGRYELVTGPATGTPPLVRLWTGTTFLLFGEYVAFDSAGDGVSIGSTGGSSALRFTSADTTTFSVGTPGTFSVTTVGGELPSLTVTGALPSGVTFTDNGDRTGTLAGTPAAATGGSYSLTLTATISGRPPVTQTFTLAVNQAPAITSAAATTFGLGGPGTFTVTTSGFPVPTLSSTGALPSGVTFTANTDGTATLAGTPAPGSGGAYPLTITAVNGAGPDATQSFVLTVNTSPAFTSANAATFTVGTAGSFAITTAASPTPALSVTGALPAGVTFVDNGNGTGTLSGTPAAGTGGAYAITFTATNGILPNGVQAFTLNVNQAPVITSASNDTFIVGTVDSFTVTTTGFPTPTVTHSSGTLPTGVTFTSATRVLGGTATQTGVFPLQFTADNGGAPNAVQAFTLTVVCPAITVTPATMTDGLYLTTYGGVDFNQAGSTGSAFTWGATGLPAGLTIDVTTGVVSGTPANTALNAGVVVTVTDNFGCQGTRNTTITVRPTTDNENYVGGVGNTQYVVAAAGPATPHVLFNDNVKTGDNGPGPLSVTFGPAVNGTVSEGLTDGTFTYTPNVNFAGPTDTFSYTLTDGNGVTNSATVTVNLSGLVWYVNSSGGNGDGRSHAPFNSVTNAQAPSGDGQIIYVHTGGATTPGTITLKPSQTLWGAGQTFVLNGLTIPFTGFPTLAGTVTLATNVLVNSLRVNGSGGPAITGTTVGGNVVLNSVIVVGGTTGIALTNLAGNLTFQFTEVSGITPGASLLLSGGTGSATGRLVITTTVGRSVDIQGKTAGTVTLGGAISDTGSGIFLNNNTGATIVFTGGLALNTGTNPGFTATGGGTVTVTQNNTTVVNTITTTTGTALNVSNTIIAASGLTFRSVSANGGGNGIVLSNTGTSGGLSVTGNSAGNCGGTVTINAVGTPATVGAPDVADCTGGTIQNTTSHGISLTGTTNTSLTRMRIVNSGADGILVSNVNGFTLARSYITDGAGVAGDRGIEMGDFSTGTPVNGAITISNSTIGPTPHDNFGIGIASGTSAWSITNTVFTGSVQNSGLNFEIRNATVTSFVIDGSVFQNQSADGMQMQPAGSVAATITSATIQNSTFTGNNLHMDLNHDGTSNVTYRVLNNTFRNAQSHAVNFFSSAVQAPATGGTLNGRFVGNHIGSAGIASSGSVLGNGIRININGGADAMVLLDSNTIRQLPNGRGIEVISRNGTGGADVTVTNNQVDNDFVTTPENGGFGLASIFMQSNCVTVCNTLRADVRSNTVPAVAPNGELLAAQLALIETGASTLQLVDTGAASASCTAQLTETNTGSAAANAGCSLIPGPIGIPP